MLITAGIIALSILLPTGANPDTTPLTCSGTTQNIVCIPEESPEGGYPTGWADNSPTYSDGWMLQVNDTTNRIVWIAPTLDPTHTDMELGA